MFPLTGPTQPLFKSTSAFNLNDTMFIDVNLEEPMWTSPTCTPPSQFLQNLNLGEKSCATSGKWKEKKLTEENQKELA